MNHCIHPYPILSTPNSKVDFNASMAFLGFNFHRIKQHHPGMQRKLWKKHWHMQPMPENLDWVWGDLNTVGSSHPSFWNLPKSWRRSMRCSRMLWGSLRSTKVMLRSWWLWKITSAQSWRKRRWDLLMLWIPRQTFPTIKSPTTESWYWLEHSLQHFQTVIDLGNLPDCICIKLVTALSYKTISCFVTWPFSSKSHLVHRWLGKLWPVDWTPRPRPEQRPKLRARRLPSPPSQHRHLALALLRTELPSPDWRIHVLMTLDQIFTFECCYMLLLRSIGVVLD